MSWRLGPAFTDAKIPDRVKRALGLGLAARLEGLLRSRRFVISAADRIPLPRTTLRQRAPVLAAIDLSDALLVGLNHLSLASHSVDQLCASLLPIALLIRTQLGDRGVGAVGGLTDPAQSAGTPTRRKSVHSSEPARRANFPDVCNFDETPSRKQRRIPKVWTPYASTHLAHSLLPWGLSSASHS